MKLITRLVTTAALSMAAFVGCSDDGGGSATPSATVDAGSDVTLTFPDAVEETVQDTATPQPDTTVTPQEPLKIEFVAAVGDDGLPCKNNTRCSVSMSFNQSRDLEVRVVRGKDPVGEIGVKWTITKYQNNSLKLGAATTFTLPEGAKIGQAATSVQQTAAQVQQYEVKAEITGSDAAGTGTPIFFDVAVTPKGQIPLTVTYKYTGKRTFQGVVTYLFKHTADKKFTCATMDPKNLPTADLSSPPKSLTQSTPFTSLPGLAEEGTQVYTVVGIGKDVSGPSLVWGCDDTKAEVTLTGSKTVPVNLMDLPPLWKKSFDVTTKFDLVSVLPANVQKYVNILLGLFTDPAAQLLVVVCDAGQNVSIIGQLCDFAFKDPANPCIEDSCFDSIGLAIKDLMTKLLYDLIEKSDIASNIFFTGQDVANILKNLEIGSTYQIKEEPAADGTIPSSTTFTEWHTITYRWSLGTDCTPDDLDCGKRSFNVQAFQGGTITGTWSGRVDYPDGQYLLTIDPHSLNIKYGALLLYIVEKELLPRLGGDGTDGNPKVDSLEEYLKTLVGGKDCLKLEFDPQSQTSCCQIFAENITSSTSGGFTSDIAKSACEVALPLAVDQLTKYITGLDVDTGNGFTLATAEPCACYDNDANLTIDAWGKKSEACHWDTNVNIGGNSLDVTNDFWGIEQQ